MNDSQLRVFVAGHNGMVGSALIRRLKKHANVTLITRNRSVLDLTDQKLVYDFFQREKIDQVGQ